MSGIVPLISTFLQEHAHLIKDQQKRLKEFEKTAKKDIYFGKDGKKKFKLPVDPNKPKKAESAYVLFVKDKIASVKKANPNSKQNELFALVATQWGSLDTKTKDVRSRLFLYLIKLLSLMTVPRLVLQLQSC